jgi:hypothetical protein
LQPRVNSSALTARRVKDAAGTAKPLVLDAAGWLCYFTIFLRSAYFGGLFSYTFFPAEKSFIYFCVWGLTFYLQAFKKPRFLFA